MVIVNEWRTKELLTDFNNNLITSVTKHNETCEDCKRYNCYVYIFNKTKIIYITLGYKTAGKLGVVL